MQFEILTFWFSMDIHELILVYSYKYYDLHAT